MPKIIELPHSTSLNLSDLTSIREELFDPIDQFLKDGSARSKRETLVSIERKRPTMSSKVIREPVINRSH